MSTSVRFILAFFYLPVLAYAFRQALKDKLIVLPLAYVLVGFGTISNMLVMTANGFKMPVKVYDKDAPLYPDDRQDPS